MFLELISLSAVLRGQNGTLGGGVGVGVGVSYLMTALCRSVIRQELLIRTIQSLEDRNKTPDQYIQSGRDWERKRKKK